MFYCKPVVKINMWVFGHRSESWTLSSQSHRSEWWNQGLLLWYCTRMLMVHLWAAFTSHWVLSEWGLMVFGGSESCKELSIALTHTVLSVVSFDSCKTEPCVCVYPWANFPVIRSRLCAKYVNVTEANRSSQWPLEFFPVWHTMWRKVLGHTFL